MANEPSAVDMVRAMEVLVGRMLAAPVPSKECAAAFDEALAHLERLDVEACTYPAGGYIREALSSLRCHLRSLAGLDEDNELPREMHHSWGLSILRSIRTSWTFDRSPRGRSASED